MKEPREESIEELIKVVQREYYKNYRERIKEKIRAYQAEYRATHREELRKKNRLYWERKAKRINEEPQS